eukprot:4145473-Pyramimonas_sp.AAC.1
MVHGMVRGMVLGVVLGPSWERRNYLSSFVSPSSVLARAWGTIRVRFTALGWFGMVWDDLGWFGIVR